jgi:hypothetical protein
VPHVRITCTSLRASRLASHLPVLDSLLKTVGSVAPGMSGAGMGWDRFTLGVRFAAVLQRGRGSRNRSCTSSRNAPVRDESAVTCRILAGRSWLALHAKEGGEGGEREHTPGAQWSELQQLPTSVPRPITAPRSAHAKYHSGFGVSGRARSVAVSLFANLCKRGEAKVTTGCE